MRLYVEQVKINLNKKSMALDPNKAVLFIEGKQVRYKQGGIDGVIQSFSPKPISAVFQGINIIVTLEDGKKRCLEGPSYNCDRSL